MHFSDMISEYRKGLEAAGNSGTGPDRWVDLQKMDELSGRSWCSEELLPFLLDKSREKLPLPSAGEDAVFSDKLRLLAARANDRLRLRGIQELAVGFPFISGSIADHEPINAPLLCFSVTLSYEDDAGIWTIAHGEGAWISSTIAHAACALSGTEEYAGELDFSSIDEIPFIDEYAFPEAAASLAASLGLYVSPNGLSGGITAWAHGVHAPGSCVFVSSMVLGLFPRFEKQIIDDICAYAKNPAASPAAEILKQDEQSLQISAARHQVDESHACFVTPLDISQERVVLAGSVGQSLAVTAPPGTGSSQVIMNIIADHLIRGRRTLVVSPHADDLRTLYTRLSELGMESRVVFVTDPVFDRRRVFSGYKELLESSTVGEDQQQYQSDLLSMKNACGQLSHDIDKQLAKLDDLHSLFKTAAPVGLTLHELYVNTSRDPELMIDEIAEHPETFGTVDKAAYEQIKAGFLEIRDSIHLMLPGHILSSRSSCADMLPSEREEALAMLDHAAALISEYQLGQDRLLGSWAAEVLPASQDPGAYGAEVLSMLDQVISEVKASRLLPPFDEEEKQQMDELIRELQEAHSWQPKFWRAFRKLKRRPRDGEGVFSYGKRIRYSLYILERLRSLERSLEISLPYGQKGEIAARLGKCRAEVQYYLDLWKVIAPLSCCLQASRIRELYREALSGNGEEAVSFLREFSSSYRELFGDAEVLDQVIQKTHPLMGTVIDAYIRHTSHDLDMIRDVGFKSIRNSIYNAQIRAMEQEHGKTLQLIDHIEETVACIEKNAREKRDSIPNLIARKGSFSISEYLNREDQESQASLRELWHAVQGSRGGPALRQAARGSMAESLLQLAPCWIMSPEAVSAVLPREVIFDTVLIDSSSQISAVRSLPIVSRGKSAVCFGDEKLLPPYDGYTSLFRFAELRLPHMELAYCRGISSEELAAFPLDAWYGSRMLAAPDVCIPRSRPVSWVSAGESGGKELSSLGAEAAVEMMQLHPDKNLAVILWDEEQRDAVETALEAYARAGEDARIGIRRKFSEGSLVVCTADEAPADPFDYVVIAVGDSVIKTLHDPVWERRFATMVTRAASHLRVITSIDPEELEQEPDMHDRGALLAAFLRFARAVSSGDAEQMLSHKTARTLTPFQKQLMQALTERGLEVHAQPGLTGYPLDLAVWDPESQCYVLGIMCEDAALTARENDICMPRFLSSRGWKTMRVWSRDWWLDPASAAQRIETAALGER